jgi:Ca2+-transporting ATPase
MPESVSRRNSAPNARWPRFNRWRHPRPPFCLAASGGAFRRPISFRVTSCCSRPATSCGDLPVRGGCPLGEAALTGESVPVVKQIDPLAEPELSLGDRTNMAFKGTIAAYGRGRGIVIATGMDTELGKIAATLAAAGEARRLSRSAWPIASPCGRCGGHLRPHLRRRIAARRGPLLMLLTALSVAVAAVPEALPAVVTILSPSVPPHGAAHALVRRLPAVETLGAVTYICADKTGTLTRNEMRTRRCSPTDALHRRSRPDRAIPGRRSSRRWPSATMQVAALTANGRATRRVALARSAADAGYGRPTLDLTAPRVAGCPSTPNASA